MTKRLAKIVAGVVTNIGVFEDDFVEDGVTLVAIPRAISIGSTFVNGVFTQRTAPVRMPDFVTKLQFVRALRAAGNWGGVKQSLAQASLEIKEDWDFVHILNRSDEVIAMFADALSLTETDVDDLFVDADKR